MKKKYIKKNDFFHLSFSHVMKIAAQSVAENGARKASRGTSRSLLIPKRPTPEKKNGVEKSTAVARMDKI